MRYFLEEHFQPLIAFIHLTDISIYSELLSQRTTCSPYIWMVPSLFQEITCSDLTFSRELCFFKTSTFIPFFKDIELIRNSSFSHPFNVWSFFIINEQLQLRILSSLPCLCRTGIAAIRYYNIDNYSKQCLVDLRKYERYFYLRQALVALLP